MTREEQVEYFSHYSVVSHYELINSTRVFIGSDSTQRCRYCGKKSPQTTFSKIAHTVPQLTSNKTLIAKDECDRCNDFFSSKLEDDFGKYLGIIRTISCVRGSKGIPKYKGKNIKNVIVVENNQGKNIVKVFSTAEEMLFELDHENKRVKISVDKQTYVPMGAFKCLVKMAIAITPREQLGELTHLISWIRDETHSYESFQFNPLIVFEQLTPGINPYQGVYLCLLKRKEGKTKVPYMQFWVAFGNRMHQIVLPMPLQDKDLMGKKIDIAFHPTPFDVGWPLGKTTKQIRDLSSSEPIKGEKEEIFLKIDNVKEITEEQI